MELCKYRRQLRVCPSAVLLLLAVSLQGWGKVKTCYAMTHTHTEIFSKQPGSDNARKSINVNGNRRLGAELFCGAK